MSLKIDPEMAFEAVEQYLQELEYLSKRNYKEGSEKKSELNSKIRGFIRTAFEDGNERLKGYSIGPIMVNIEHIPSEKEKQNDYICDLKQMKTYLISFKEEIALTCAHKKSIDKMKQEKSSNDLKQDNTNFKELFNDLQIIIDSCEEDLANDKNIEVSWKNYVKEYNSILLELHESGVFKSLKLISDKLDATYMIPLKPYQIAKVREIVTNSKKLQYRIQKLIIEPNETTINYLQIFSRFHLFINQLKKKHRSGNIITVENEYDVQYLFHPLLKIFFDDIRPEDPTPSHAGGSTKIDFLLKEEKIGIEIKMTRPTLTNTELRKQLNDDIITYKKHVDCETLIIYIYDPEGHITNPKGFIQDFNEQTTDDFKVIVFISP